MRVIAWLEPSRKSCNQGANDVWVVKRKGKRDLLLPYIPPVVLNVDIPNKRVDVEILEGLDDED